MADPDWLLWAREIQAIAQTGLAFSKDPYDLDRYTALTRLSARIMAARSSAKADPKQMTRIPSKTGMGAPGILELDQ